MAISDSFDFSMTRDECITEALDQLGVLGEGATPTAAQLVADGRTLNLLLKSWQNKDLSQNLLRRCYVFLTPGQREYTLSTTVASSDESTTSFFRDEIQTALVAAETVIAVSGTSSANSDRIGLVMDNDVVHWTTISSGGGTTAITLASGIPTGRTVAVAATVYIYTNKLLRPIDLIYGTVSTGATDVGQHNAINETATPLMVLTREEWTNLSNKDAGGQVNSFWYNEQWPDAKLHVWPTPVTGDHYLELWQQATIDDMDGGTNNFALPSRWYLAVALQLALHMTPKYGSSDKTFGKIAKLADDALFMAETGENENSLQFRPDDRGG